jgi:hypothetical protein
MRWNEWDLRSFYFPMQIKKVKEWLKEGFILTYLLIICIRNWLKVIFWIYKLTTTLWELISTLIAWWVLIFSLHIQMLQLFIHFKILIFKTSKALLFLPNKNTLFTGHSEAVPGGGHGHGHPREIINYYNTLGIFIEL